MTESSEQNTRHRKRLRLAGFDYAGQGPYFVTVCTKDRACLFGNVVDDSMRLNAAGIMARDVWLGLPTHYVNVVLDAFVVMPNHVHGILWLAEDDETAEGIREQIGAAPYPVGAGLKPAPGQSGSALKQAGFKPAPTGNDRAPIADARRHALPEIMRGFKTFSSRAINGMRGVAGVPLWQRNYYEHIIRNDIALNHIRDYIEGNSARWSADRDNPAAIHPERKDAWRL
jgi:REP element-mobilizing transposase RayT